MKLWEICGRMKLWEIARQVKLREISRVSTLAHSLARHPAPCACRQLATVRRCTNQVQRSLRTYNVEHRDAVLTFQVLMGPLRRFHQR
jgi:hypothetical protein